MPVNPMPVNLWTKTDHALEYLGRADSIAHRTEGESSLLEFIPQTTRRILDLGTGDGRLLALVLREQVKREHPNTEAVAIDFSPTMIEAAKRRFAGDSSVAVITHNLDDPLPTWASLTLSSPASRSIMWRTSASARSTPKSTND